MVAGSGTPITSVDAEKLAVEPALFALITQVPSVSSKPVMDAMPGPDRVMLLAILELMVRPVASKL